MLGSNAVFSNVRAPWARDYLALLKPRVMSLVVFTGFTGLILAPAGFTFKCNREVFEERFGGLLIAEAFSRC